MKNVQRRQNNNTYQIPTKADRDADDEYIYAITQGGARGVASLNDECELHGFAGANIISASEAIATNAVSIRVDRYQRL